MPATARTSAAATPRAAPRLTKSRLIDGLQCPRKLWLAVNNPGCVPQEAGRDATTEEGNRVGALARELARRQYERSEYIGVSEPLGWPGGLARSAEVLAEGGPCVLFEAPFAAGAFCALSDIVMRQADGELWLIEVKSATKLAGKPFIDDVSFQAWAMGECGFPPDRVLIRLIDNTWTYTGDDDYRGLFRDEDVTDQVRERLPHVPELLRACQGVVASAEPATRTGSQCHKPRPCAYAEHCQAWESEQFGPPVEFPISLIGGRFKGKFTKTEEQRIADKGWADLRELPARFPSHPRARAIVTSARTGKPTALKGLRAALDALPYPRYHFDFETINPAIPLWAGTHPYQQVPFQWSCHVEQRDGSVEHHAFLDLSGGDPREECARRIVALLGGNGGAVIVYFQPFEETRLKELARDLPHHAKGLQRVIGKLRDLLPIVGEHYYHPGLNGSFSIKAVLPTIAPELDYAQLSDVQDGSAAQLAWLDATASGTPTARRAELEAALLAYCQRDTEAMLVLTHRLAAMRGQ